MAIDLQLISTDDLYSRLRANQFDDCILEQLKGESLSTEFLLFTEWQ